MAQMNHLEYIEYLCKQYRNEASVELYNCSMNKAKIKRLGIELRQATLEFDFALFTLPLYNSTAIASFLYCLQRYSMYQDYSFVP